MRAVLIFCMGPIESRHFPCFQMSFRQNIGSRTVGLEISMRPNVTALLFLIFLFASPKLSPASLRTCCRTFTGSVADIANREERGLKTPRFRGQRTSLFYCYVTYSTKNANRKRLPFISSSKRRETCSLSMNLPATSDVL